MTVGTALQQGTRLLEESATAAPRLTAEVLLAHAIGCDRPWLYAHSDDELKELWWIHYGRYLHERIEGKPTQYITRRQEFWGRDFRVSPAVLIPRPETEHVIEQSLASFKNGLIVDVGTGSGAIAITLQLETGAPVIATDVSTEALLVAADNSRRLGATVRFVKCDLLSALADGAAALVASNPPYVPETDEPALQREVVEHEPHVALFGGPDGLDVYRRLIADARRVLRPGGTLVMETAYNAEGPLTAMLSEQWSDIAMHRDLAGLPRVVTARRRV
jgi:release factor glutamine methyltransferase